MATQGWARLCRIRTGNVAGNIVLLLFLLAGAWALITWTAVRAIAGSRPARIVFWAAAAGTWPAAEFLGLRAAMAAFALSCVPLALCATAQRRQRAAARRAWAQMKAVRELRPPAARKTATATIRNEIAWHAVRLDRHDMEIAALSADLGGKCGEFLYVAREVAALAGIAPYRPRRPDLRVVREGEVS